MSVTSIIGLLMSLGVLIVGLYSSSPNIMVFWDGISLFIVLGGTLAATSISFRLERMLFLIKVFFMRVLKSYKNESQKVVGQLIQFAEAFKKKDKGKVQSLLAKCDDAFLKESIELLLEDFLDQAKLLEILENRKENIYAHYLVDANKFKTIGKYPPAFGMMGTTIGMIVLLSQLGGPDSAKTIGPAMGICLITTLYGVALSNLLIIPVAEQLTVSAREIRSKNQIICEGIRLIMLGENPIVMAEELNSFFLPGDRINWKDLNLSPNAAS